MAQVRPVPDDMLFKQKSALSKSLPIGSKSDYVRYRAESGSELIA